jgi:hypothetical protein
VARLSLPVTDVLPRLSTRFFRTYRSTLTENLFGRRAYAAVRSRDPTVAQACKTMRNGHGNETSFSLWISGDAQLLPRYHNIPSGRWILVAIYQVVWPEDVNSVFTAIVLEWSPHHQCKLLRELVACTYHGETNGVTRCAHPYGILIQVSSSKVIAKWGEPSYLRASELHCRKCIKLRVLL